MIYFDYDKTSSKAEYYEILQDLMERWEYEIVEFKKISSFLCRIMIFLQAVRLV